jgi:hypothetical protein
LPSTVTRFQRFLQYRRHSGESCSTPNPRAFRLTLVSRDYHACTAASQSSSRDSRH